MMNSSRQYFNKLPKTLQSFFKKYPPNIEYCSKPTSTHDFKANPFLPNKHPVTEKYQNPAYSRRRASVIFKEATRWGVESLLPPFPQKRFFEDKYHNKPVMKGVLRPKGHKYEHTKEARQKKIEVALENADKKIIDAKGQKYARRLERKKKDSKVTWV